MTMMGKTVLITGSTDGVGRRVAMRLAAEGATVLVHGRDGHRGRDVVSQIRKAGGAAEFYQADFSALSEVRGLAERIQRDHPRLDGLISNAGIGVGADRAYRETSADGYELRFAVNYLAGFLLTRLLLGALRSAHPARIVNVASVGQQPIDFDDVMLDRGYGGVRAYCQSKLAQIMSTFDLADELRGSNVTANCLHPASYMDTTMVRTDGIAPVSNVDEGAEAILHLAASPEIAGNSGLYFNGVRPSRAHSQAYDPVAGERLRLLSRRLVGLPAAGPR